ncbi:venom allergen 5-like [Anopheles bellator]|uniref:venom allergen 5-like n=1 Tax=Anopheles bellator TaxID=139047 RepID=UPI00264870D4|nr:venom allergen 5-like [Anopheles bellator]
MAFGRSIRGTAWLVIFVASGFCYKDDRYCSLCSHHIACGNTDQLHGDCLKYSGVNLTDLGHYRHQITAHVNHLRDKFASGHVNGFNELYGPMHFVTWDEDMADLCRLNVNSCKFGHDKCRATPNHPYCGQTLGKLTKCVPTNREKELTINVHRNVILHLIDRWFAEHLDTKPTDVKHYSHNSSLRKYEIGHFLQLINCNVCKMGCSLVSYREHRHHSVCSTYILCCNYSYINIINRPICSVNRYPGACEKNGYYHHLCQHCSL